MGDSPDRLILFDWQKEFIGWDGWRDMSIPDWIVGKIPQRMRGAVLRYIMDGIAPGSFITAIFENNFYEAACCADEENCIYFRQYAMMLNSVPAGCWGSREIVNKWMRIGGLNGLREQQGVEDEHSDNNGL